METAKPKRTPHATLSHKCRNVDRHTDERKPPLTLPSPARGEGKTGRPKSKAGRDISRPYALPQGEREKREGPSQRPGEIYLAPTHSHKGRGKNGKAQVKGRARYISPLRTPTRGEGKTGRPKSKAGRDISRPYALPQGEREKREGPSQRPGEIYLAPTHSHKWQGKNGRAATLRQAQGRRPTTIYRGPATARPQRKPRDHRRPPQPVVVCWRWDGVWCKRRAKNRLDIIVYILENENAKFGSEK